MHNDSFYPQTFIPSPNGGQEDMRVPHIWRRPNGIGMDCPHVVQAAICILKQPHFQSRSHKVDDVATMGGRADREREGGGYGGPVKSSTSLQRSLTPESPLVVIP